MGSVHSSQLSPKQLSDLQRETNLTGDEILDWYRKFQVDFSSSSGMVTKEQFTKLYERLFPLGDPSEFVENVFRFHNFFKCSYTCCSMRCYLITLFMSNKLVPVYQLNF